MKSKSIYENKYISLNVLFDKWSFSFLPQLELNLHEENNEFQHCGYLELKWFNIGFSITYYGKMYR